MDLDAIKEAILDRLKGLDRIRDKPCRWRSTNVDVYPMENEWGWSANPIGDWSNNKRRDFIAACIAVQRRLVYSPA
jgi:hypothetical protein